MLLNLIKVKIK